MKTSQDFNENFNQYSSEIEKEMSIEPSTFAQSIKSKEETNYVTERFRTV